MIQTYTGYFQDGCFYTENNVVVRIPEKKRVILNVLNDENIDVNNVNKKRLLALNKFVAKMKKCSEDLPDDFDEILAHGKLNFNREIDI